MMKRQYAGYALALALCWVSLAGVAQPDGDSVPRVLLVDATKTFHNTLLVGGLIGALRATGSMTIDVRLVDATSMLVDPLAGVPVPEAPYDVLVFAPRGLDSGSTSEIWIVSDALSRLAPLVQTAVAVLSQTIDAVFQGIGEAVDASEDAYPILLWAAYLAAGWVR